MSSNQRPDTLMQDRIRQIEENSKQRIAAGDLADHTVSIVLDLVDRANKGKIS